MKFLIKVSKGRSPVGVQDHKCGIRMEGGDEAIGFLYRGGQVTGRTTPRGPEEKERGNGRGLDVRTSTFHIGHFELLFFKTLLGLLDVISFLSSSSAPRQRDHR